MHQQHHITAGITTAAISNSVSIYAAVLHGNTPIEIQQFLQSLLCTHWSQKGNDIPAPMTTLHCGSIATAILAVLL
jgi:hypothetical protein